MDKKADFRDAQKRDFSKSKWGFERSSTLKSFMILQKLWNKHPIFYLSLYFLLGNAFFLKPHYIYCLPLCLLLFFSKWRLQGMIFFFIALGYTYFTQPKFPNFKEEVYGKGIFHLQKISPSQTPFQQSLCLKGILKKFHTEKECFIAIPCVIFLERGKNLPEGNSWALEGKLIQKGPFYFVFKPCKKLPWEIRRSGFSLAKWRAKQKEKIRSFFYKRIKEKPVSHFFSILATGDIDDFLLSSEFQRLGLGHILAISGLHFALIAYIFIKVLQKIFSSFFAFFLLLAFLGLYCLFLGGSPSILRAFIMISLWIFSLFLKREAKGLNFLGVALLFELIFDPLSLTYLGFQLSFLTTAGIFLYYPFFNFFFHKLLPKRELCVLLNSSKIQQHIYLFLFNIRSCLSLNAAVFIMTFIPILYVFSSFPILSLFYNLFIPSLLMVSMFLIPLGILFFPIEICNIYFTSFILRLISQPPQQINYAFHIVPFSYTMLIFLMTGIFFAGCFFCTKKWDGSVDQKKKPLQN